MTANTQTIADQLAAGHARFFDLVKQFPSVEHAPGTDPWDALKFAKWATEICTPGSQRLLAAQFLLSVWENRNGTPERPAWFNEGEFAVGYFDPVLASMVWDYQHRGAFAAWIAKPFFP